MMLRGRICYGVIILGGYEYGVLRFQPYEAIQSDLGRSALPYSRRR